MQPIGKEDKVLRPSRKGEEQDTVNSPIPDNIRTLERNESPAHLPICVSEAPRGPLKAQHFLCGKRLFASLRVGDRCSIEDFEEFSLSNPGFRFEYLDGVIHEKMSRLDHNGLAVKIDRQLTHKFQAEPTRLDLSPVGRSSSFPSSDLHVATVHGVRLDYIDKRGRERSSRYIPDVLIVPQDSYDSECRGSSPSSGSGHGGSPPGDGRRREPKLDFAKPHLPVIVMEVVSTEKKRDTVMKHEIYAKGGIQEYWIVFARDGKREVRVCTLDSPDSDKYTDRTYQPDEVIRHSLLSPYEFTAGFFLGTKNLTYSQNITFRKLAEETKRADEAVKQREKEKKRADEAIKAREATERRLQELQEQLRDASHSRTGGGSHANVSEVAGPSQARRTRRVTRSRSEHGNVVVRSPQSRSPKSKKSRRASSRRRS